MPTYNIRHNVLNLLRVILGYQVISYHTSVMLLFFAEEGTSV